MLICPQYRVTIVGLLPEQGMKQLFYYTMFHDTKKLKLLVCLTLTLLHSDGVLAVLSAIGLSSI